MAATFDFRDTDRKYRYNGRLGAIYHRSHTDFAVWSPYAESITLNLYKGSDIKDPYLTGDMMPDQKGVWRCRIDGDLDGIYYTYTAVHNGISREACDIYARTACANSRRGMIFSPRAVDIDGWKKDIPVQLADPVDAVIYELHIRDFSMDCDAGFKNRGKFAAFSEDGICNAYGDAIGIDYLKQLGITHVHLLPVMDFASVDEMNSSFNWGYDPILYNVPEGSYSLEPNNGYSRVKELKKLVLSLHSNGIGVILDVVYNHTYNADNSPFDVLFPHYYYRHDGNGYSNGSGCGNELATERAMVSKFICDSLCFLAREYHIDGFRFDLMGLMDIRTLNRCAAHLRSINPDMLLYGEGWTGGTSPMPEKLRAMKHNAAKTNNIAMFSDDFRDGVKGSVFNDSDCGYINGAASKTRRELIKSVLCGGISHPYIARPQYQCWAQKPQHCINYVEAHDNLTFRDKLAVSMPQADNDELVRVNRLGAALIFLAQGIPFMQAGQEFMRSKSDRKGRYIHDSYNSPDSINCLKWNDLTDNRITAEYYKGLIAIRRRYSAFRMRNVDDIKKIHFTDLGGSAFAMHIEDMILIVNPHRRSAAFILPKGQKYNILADGEYASAEPFGILQGRISIKKQSILLLKEIE